MEISQRLVRFSLRLLRNLSFDRERFGNRPRPALRWILGILPSPTVYWSNGARLKPLLSNRLWVVDAVKRYHEPALDTMLARCLRAGDVVIDVGGQIGVTVAMAARQVGAGGTVHTFEPFEENRRVLQQSLALNRITNVVCRPEAVSDALGVLKFAPEAYSGLIQRSEPVDDGFEIPVTTLDAYVTEKGLERVDFVKVDVDGPDFRVVLGASELASRSEPPFFCVECSPYWQRFDHAFADAFKFFRTRGYSLAVAHRRGHSFTLLGDLSDLPAGWGVGKSQAFNFFAFKPGYHDYVADALGLER